MNRASSDEVNSKKEKSVEEEHKDSSEQSAPVDEYISRKGSMKENLPNDMTEEEETGNDPKQKDKDKSKSEGDEKHSTEKRGVYSETSKQESAHKTRRTEEIVALTFHDEIVPFKPNFNHHIATDHANTGNETIPEGWKSNDEESAFQPPGNSASPILSSAQARVRAARLNSRVAEIMNHKLTMKILEEMEFEAQHRQDMSPDQMNRDIRKVRNIFKGLEKSFDIAFAAGILAVEARPVDEATARPMEEAVAYAAGLSAAIRMEKIIKANSYLPPVCGIIDGFLGTRCDETGQRRSVLPDTDPEEVCDDSLFHHWFCSDAAIESDDFNYVQRKELASSALEWVKKLKGRLQRTLKLAGIFQPYLKQYLKAGSQMMSPTIPETIPEGWKS